MAKQAGLGDKLYVHGRDLSGDISSVDTISARRATIDVPVIEDSAMSRLQGLADGEISLTTWFDDAALLEHATFSALPTTDINVLYIRGSAASSPAAGLVAKQINYDASRGQDRSLTFNVQALSQGTALEWGEMFAAEATAPSAGNSSSKDDSASSSNGLAAYLHIVDINSGTPTFKIQDSANDSDWADLVGFTAVANGNEPTSERVTVSGTVNRYLRVTTTGTFSNAKYVLMYRRGESTDDPSY